MNKLNANQNSGKIAASIEIAPKQGIESDILPGRFPAGTRVYITDVGTDSPETLTAAAKRVRALGYEPVPHFASRRIASASIVRQRLEMMTKEAGVKDVLVIGGGLEKQAGEFSSTMEVLETGLFQEFGITDIGIAGHPEGSPDFSTDVAAQALRLKQEFGERSGINMRIVTQFGFDADGFIHWAEDLKAQGITMPVHLGVAGPAKLPTLLKFAVMCGVGASIQYLKRNMTSLTTLATGHAPDEIVNPIERHIFTNPDTNIAQVHVFAFGGLKNASQWLVDRGSWDINTSLYASAKNA